MKNKNHICTTVKRYIFRRDFVKVEMKNMSRRHSSCEIRLKDHRFWYAKIIYFTLQNMIRAVNA